MSTTLVIWIALASSVAGGFLGFLLGRLTQATVQIGETMKQQSTEDAGASRRKFPRFNGMAVLAVLVTAMSLATVALGLVIKVQSDHSDDEREKLVSCVVAYSNQLGDALEARSNGSASATAQLDAVMEAVVRVFNTQDLEAQKALVDAANDYVNKRKDSRETLKQNPYPTVPRDACAQLRR